MSVDERARHELFVKLDETIGPGPTETMMALLPPVGWADVATKEYVDARLETTEARLRTEMKDLKAEFAVQTRTLLFAMFGLNTTLAGIVLAALKLG